ncbi:MAG: acylphosphatase [Candidatus Thermoplasmatota archaeon]|nr:acylphosphatase [Candidatus Thermoplasmatota archaeon]
MKRAHVWISGRVQGVWYRANTQKQAEQRGIAGWVRNLPDGRVEAVFEGPEKEIEDMIQWCHTGSPMAHVDDVEVQWEDPAGLDGFHIKR